MKRLFFLLPLTAFFGCNQQGQNTKALQQRIDTLEHQLAHTYKPGLGEFMSGIQVHHNKLWFAGKNENWKLADFEVHEIMESIDAIRQYETERKESQMVSMIMPALDSVNKAIQQKNATAFKSSYVFLTNSCNSCHQATGFGFNAVKVPDQPPFSNQDFTPLSGR